MPTANLESGQGESMARTRRTLEEFTIGRCYNGHLGDTLCLSPLPRLLTTVYGTRVYVSQHPSHRGVFANNPYVSGIRKSRGVRLEARIRGYGHLTQRIQKRFGAVFGGDPRPEIYLSNEERQWARRQRSQWPANRPVCILATRAIAESKWYGNVDWVAVGRAWMESCTVVQAILTKPSVYRAQVARTQKARQALWKPESPVPGAITFEDLALRRFLSLFSVADFFCGPASGGAHVAAAFGLPSLVVLWRGLLQALRFPTSSRGFATEVFLYPQHRYVALEDLLLGAVNQNILERHVRGVLACQGSQGRGSPRQPIGDSVASPIEFLDGPLQHGLRTTNGRVLPVLSPLPRNRPQHHDVCPYQAPTRGPGAGMALPLGTHRGDLIART